jgi:glycosyltransferase involved in cell wall biosynthesis
MMMDGLLTRSQSIVCVIPTLNEAPTIGEVIKGALNYADRVVVVDGNSGDNTILVAEKNGAEILTQEGVGKGMAVRTAFNRIFGDIYVIIDGDATYDAVEIDELVSPILNGEADMVVGSRLSGKMEKGSISRTHLVGNSLFNALINLLHGSNIKDSQSGFRAINGRFVRDMGLRTEGFEIETEITIRALKQGLRVKEIPITYRRRRGSNSKIHSISSGWKILRTIIKCSFEDQVLLNEVPPLHQRLRRSHIL